MFTIIVYGLMIMGGIILVLNIVTFLSHLSNLGAFSVKKEKEENSIMGAEDIITHFMDLDFEKTVKELDEASFEKETESIKRRLKNLIEKGVIKHVTINEIDSYVDRVRGVKSNLPKDVEIGHLTPQKKRDFVPIVQRCYSKEHEQKMIGLLTNKMRYCTYHHETGIIGSYFESGSIKIEILADRTYHVTNGAISYRVKDTQLKLLIKRRFIEARDHVREKVVSEEVELGETKPDYNNSPKVRPMCGVSLEDTF